MQMSFSEKLKSLNPDTLFGFREEDVFIQYDLNEDYGITGSSNVFSQTDSTTFQPRLVTVNKKSTDLDTDVLYNQITESEYYNDKDSSIVIGRNSSNYNGNLYYMLRDDASFNMNDISVDKIYTNYWQMYFGANDLKTRYKYIDYDANNDYAVVMVDTSYGDSYVFKKNMYTVNGDLECWEDVLNPRYLPPDTILQYDQRMISISIINPRTGEVYDSYPLSFLRNSTMRVGVNCELYDNTFENVYSAYETNSRNSSGKPKIKDIVTTDSQGRLVKLKRWQAGVDITIPQLNNIRIEVDIGEIPQRDNITENGTDQSPQQVMRYMHYDIRVLYNGTIQLFNRVTNSIDISHSIGSMDKSVLFACKQFYTLNSGHSPAMNQYDYNFNYQFIIDNVEYPVKTVSYKGSTRLIRDRGIGREIYAVPTFENMPVMIGFMPTQTKNNKEFGKYNFNIGGNHFELEHVKYLRYGTTNNYVYFDNFATFKSNEDSAYKYYYDLYFSTFRQDNLLIDKNLMNYWACDKLGDDLRSLPNRFIRNNYINYDVYSEIRLKGRGRVYHDKEYHRILKDSIRFENITGNCNLYNSWDNSGSYTINFWFKSKQKTKGTIFSDIEKIHPNTKGIYVGVSDGGYLEVAFNALDSRIYNTTNITDDKWHMITILCTRLSTPANSSNFEIRIDNRKIDNLVGTNINKDYTKDREVYFMGHPFGKNVIGSLGRIAFYDIPLSNDVMDMIFSGDIEHHVRGTVILENVPFETEIRVYNNRTGDLVSRVTSDKETGNFLYRNYEDFSVYLLVMDFAKKFGDMQAIGPIEPKSLI